MVDSTRNEKQVMVEDQQVDTIAKEVATEAADEEKAKNTMDNEREVVFIGQQPRTMDNSANEVVMEGEAVEDDHGPTEANKEFQQPSKEVDTDESSKERYLDYDDQFDNLPDTEDVIFDKRRKKIVFGDNDEDNDIDNDYMPDDFDSDPEDNEYEVVLTVNGSDAHGTTTSKSACDTQGAAANAEVHVAATNAGDQGATAANTHGQGAASEESNQEEQDGRENRINTRKKIKVRDPEIRRG